MYMYTYVCIVVNKYFNKCMQITRIIWSLQKLNSIYVKCKLYYVISIRTGECIIISVDCQQYV